MNDQTTEQCGVDPARELAFEALPPDLLFRVLDAIKDRVYIKDAQGRVTYVNQAFLDTYGLVADDVLGKRNEEFLPEEMISLCQTADESVVDQRKTICIETHWREPEQGAHHWSEAYKSPIRDSKDNVLGVVGICRDITARRTAEEELNRHKALLEQIVDTVPDWIFVKDSQRRIVQANRTFYEQLGVTPEDVLDRDPNEYLPAELEKVAHETDSAVLERGQVQCTEVTLTNPEGKEIYLEVRKLPIFENNQVVGIVSVGRDLTEAKRREQESMRNEKLLLHASRLSSLGELAAGIAHEVNQPLFSILNYSIAIQNKLRESDTLDMKAVRKWLQQIHSEATRGGKITQRLKSFAKPTESQRTTEDINAIVLESIEFLRLESRDSDVTIETALSADLPEIAVDRIQIEQVLVNLLKNALEACCEQTKQTSVITVSTSKDPSGIRVSVADNGTGIADFGDLSIFDPFQTTKQGGVGLGLAISKSIIEAHCGQLSYESTEQQGATFTFLIPAES